MSSIRRAPDGFRFPGGHRVGIVFNIAYEGWSEGQNGLESGPYGEVGPEGHKEGNVRPQGGAPQACGPQGGQADGRNREEDRPAR